MRVLEHLVIGAAGDIKYFHHRYAERAGLQGGMNTNLTAGGRFLVEYNLALPSSLGNVGLARQGAMTGARRSASRDLYQSQSSSNGNWTYAWGWSAHVPYSPAWYVTVDFSVRQATRMLRDELANVFISGRDAAELVLM